VDQDDMNKRKLGQYRKTLQRSLSRLVGEASQTLNGMSSEKALFPDPTDRASLESDRNFLLRIRDRERKLLAKIQEALKRIDEGTFGICQECGEEISESRLKARPVATLCVECKRKQERQEKIAGV
jgi:RNA polymerase-binding transcription factor